MQRLTIKIVHCMLHAEKLGNTLGRIQFYRRFAMEGRPSTQLAHWRGKISGTTVAGQNSCWNVYATMN